MNEFKFDAYLSHSWDPENVDLNLWVWARLGERCNLRVDQPKEKEYFISRLEELMRRSDVFVAILTHKLPTGTGEATGDAGLECSPYILFEVRLAERANRPRLILFDRRTGFSQPDDETGRAKYIAFDRGEGEPLPDALETIEQEIRHWLEWLDRCRRPQLQKKSDRSLLLMPEPVLTRLREPIRKALRKAKFQMIEVLELPQETDREVVRRFRDIGLLVADVADASTRELYALAHGLFVPTIRLKVKGQDLPWILDGHPGGYQNDLLDCDGAELVGNIEERADAIFRVTQALDQDKARVHLEAPRYTPYKGRLVFVSHCLKAGERQVVDSLVALLKSNRVPHFEYFTGNEAGEDWKKKMLDALQQTTLFVALLTDRYERSKACDLEWKSMDPAKIRILPFLLNGRHDPHVGLEDPHYKELTSPDPGENAREIARRIIEELGGKPDPAVVVK